nr:ChaN family lipoprotein [Rhodoferax sp.]
MTVTSLWTVAAVIVLIGCAATAPPQTSYPDPGQIRQLLPADAILLGEQHDAPDHQRIHRFVVETLAAERTLAALALEMASQGQSTEMLGPDADEDLVRAALQWNSGPWSWTVYGPVVMAAVRAGVPVVGANLPAARLRETMADPVFDMLLPGPALKAQQQRIRLGHCNLLPESQVAPMARIQIARDISMAQTVVKAALPGKTVLLLAGSSHVDRTLGIAQHLPPGFNAKTVLLHAEQVPDAAKNRAEFDQFWPAKPAPPVDYCADFSARRGKPASVPSPEKMP